MKAQIKQIDFPILKTGDRAPFRDMSFKLHDNQHAIVSEALKRSKALGDFDTTLNKNSNGNALARICERFINEI